MTIIFVTSLYNHYKYRQKTQLLPTFQRRAPKKDISVYEFIEISISPLSWKMQGKKKKTPIRIQTQ